MRFAAYFVFVVAVLFGSVTLSAVRREYLAQRWPVVSGEIVSSQERSQRLSKSTQYWVRYEVTLDLPAEECPPRQVYIMIGGPTTCHAAFSTLEGSQANAGQWLRRHSAGSHAQFHYEPHGPGVRFAGESIGNIYPWSKILVTIVLFAVGLVFLSLAQRAQNNLSPAEPSDDSFSEPSSTTNRSENDDNKLIDLQLRR